MTTALAAVGTTAYAQAQDQQSPQAVAQAQQVEFNIPAQSLVDALALFGRQSGMQVSVDAGLIRGKSSPGVSGSMAPVQALGRILAGTGVTYRLTGGNTAMLEAAPDGDGAILLDPVRVEGTMARIATTEGTGSYTTDAATVGSKIPTSIRETPQSVSVITRERLNDQNLNTIEDALRQTTGITSQPDGTAEFIYSRGFRVDKIQQDGTPTLAGPTNVYQAIAPDLAIYDRVEILRGPAGLFQGSGEPSAAINLVRKRPLDHFQVGGAASIGSWDAYRGEADVTGPIIASGRVRGRLVGVYEDKDSFVDVADSQKRVLYGTLDFDVTPDTTFSVGATYQEYGRTPFYGLPAYTDGRLLDVDRSTFLGTDWSQQDNGTLDSFAELEHRFDNGARAQLSTRYIHRTADIEAASAGGIDPATGNTSIWGTFIDNEEDNINIDGFVTSPVSLFGQTHEFLVGATYQTITTTDHGRFGPVGNQNVFAPNHNIAKPTTFSFTSDGESTQEQTGVYGQARIKPIDWGTLILGGRLSWWNATQKNLQTGITTADRQIDNIKTPYAGIVIDLNDQLSIYGSYAEIFQPQTAQSFDGGLLPPRTGDQYEVGIKGEFFSGNLNAYLAAFRIKDKNRAMNDPAHPGFSIASGENQSQGIEAEISGTVTPGWDVFAGYAFTHTEVLTAASGVGESFNTPRPEHSLLLRTNYEFQSGDLKGWSVGGGVKAVSSTYSESGDTRWEQDPYAIFDAQVGYAITESVKATVSANNIFDEKYYEKVNGSFGGNFYGEPRSFILTVRATF